MAVAGCFFFAQQLRKSVGKNADFLLQIETLWLFLQQALVGCTNCASTIVLWQYAARVGCFLNAIKCSYFFSMGWISCLIMLCIYSMCLRLVPSSNTCPLNLGDIAISFLFDYDINNLFKLLKYRQMAITKIYIAIKKNYHLWVKSEITWKQN